MKSLIASRQNVVARVAVDLHRPREAPQELIAMLTSAAGRVAKDDARRVRAAPRPVIVLLGTWVRRRSAPNPCADQQAWASRRSTAGVYMRLTATPRAATQRP